MLYMLFIYLSFFLSYSIDLDEFVLSQPSLYRKRTHSSVVCESIIPSHCHIPILSQPLSLYRGHLFRNLASESILKSTWPMKRLFQSSLHQEHAFSNDVFKSTINWNYHLVLTIFSEKFACVLPLNVVLGVFVLSQSSLHEKHYYSNAASLIKLIDCPTPIP